MDKKITKSELLMNNNEDLKKEVKTLKRTIKAQQNAYEKLRVSYIDLDKKYSVINNSIKFDIVLEISKFCITVLVAIFVGLLMLNTKNWYLRFIVGFLALLYVGIMIYQRFKNRKG